VDASSLLGVQKSGVGAGCELVERLVWSEIGQTDADPHADFVAQQRIDRSEPALNFLEARSAQPTHELVATIADDRVERAQVRSQSPDECRQHPIARGMPISVVDKLEAVDINEGEDELSTSPTGSVDFEREGERADLAAVCPREIVEVCIEQFGLKQGALAGGRGSIPGGLGPISRSPGA
jgi:hypothetical protein